MVWAVATLGLNMPDAIWIGLASRLEAIIDSFDVQNICNSLWGIAALGNVMVGESEAQDLGEVEATIQTHLRLLCVKAKSVVAAIDDTDHNFMTLSHVSMLSWGIAVLKIRDKDMVQTVCKALTEKLPFMSGADLRQVHGFLISCRLEADLGELCGAEVLAKVEGVDGGRCHKEFQSRSTTHVTMSNMQKEVATLLRSFGLEVQAEYVDAETGYSIDCLVTSPKWKVSSFPEGVPRLCAIEVDGERKPNSIRMLNGVNYRLSQTSSRGPMPVPLCKAAWA